MVINLNSFVVGAVFGVALGLGLAYVYAAGFQIGRDLHDISQADENNLFFIPFVEGDKEFGGSPLRREAH